jgi:hypothetical protein
MRALLFLFICFSISVCAQFKNTEHNFVQHLLAHKMYDEALLVLSEKLANSTDIETRDSMNFFLGKTYYDLQQLPPSIQHLDAVSMALPALYNEARFFSAFNESYLKKPNIARQKLLTFFPTEMRWQQLKNFELAGIFLLEGNLTGFDSLQRNFSNEWPVVQQQQKNLTEHRNYLKGLKSKSSLLAGALSAVVPGAGKFYAGRKGNGIYTLLITALLGAQTYEGYRKDGLKSARFIIYGSLFTSFYIGNIWGSALSVNVVRNERKDAIHHQVLFDMHIPLRTLFQ